VVIPAALVVAEIQGCSGKDFASAIVCGYEISCRIGTTMLAGELLKTGLRPSGTVGIFRCPAAAEKISRGGML
jgi:hypothetical protein